MAEVLSGIDRVKTVDSLLRGGRLGLMTNPTGITRDFAPRWMCCMGGIA